LVHQCVQLVGVCPIVLRVDVPEPRFASPDGAHQRVFAAHQVQVTHPQQFIEFALGHWFQPMQSQCTSAGGGQPHSRQSRLCRTLGPARRDQNQGGHGSLDQALQEVCQRRWLVAKQRDQALALPGNSLPSQPGVVRVVVKRGLARQIVRLTQQATGACCKAGVVEMFGPALGRAPHHGGGQGVAALHIGLGREVLQVDPHRWFWIILATRAHIYCARSYKFRSNFAAKAFDPHIGGGQLLQHRGIMCFRPVVHLHPGPLALYRTGRHPGQGAGVVHPQAYRMAAVGEVGAQAPAHADVAKVVDDLAENIPLHGGYCPCRASAPKEQAQ